MDKPKSINELLKLGGKRLTALNEKSRERSVALEHVRAALPPPLAAVVVSAGIDDAQLTIGVSSAPWAARLRYATDDLRTRVGETLGLDIRSIRIKVVRPRT